MGIDNVADITPRLQYIASAAQTAFDYNFSIFTSADLVVVATPIYKAAYSGVLKAFLDLLPQDGLQGKQVLVLGTGGSIAHLLALDYALKPVLSALGARHILDVVYAEDTQFVRNEQGHQPVDAVLHRLERALAPWTADHVALALAA